MRDRNASSRNYGLTGNRMQSTDTQIELNGHSPDENGTDKDMAEPHNDHLISSDQPGHSHGYQNTAFTSSDEDRIFVEHTITENCDAIKAYGESFNEKSVKDPLSSQGLKKRCKSWITSNSKKICNFVKILCLVLYNVYLGFAVRLTWDETPSWCHGVKFLVVLTAVIYLAVLFKHFIVPYVLKPLWRISSPLVTKLSGYRYSHKVVWSVIWISIGVFLLVDSLNNLRRLTSAAGLLIFLFFGYLFSVDQSQIVWRHVQYGILMQFVLGLLVLRWDLGKDIFQCFGDKIAAFLQFTDAGTSFVFGYLVTGELKGTPVQDAVFAFKVLSVIIFFSSIVSVLYYFGIMQLIVKKVGWFLQVTVGTTACESMNAAGNIFLGMTESPLLIRPYLPIMTKSELHAVLTGGFATIAGSVMAAYINFGISPSHLLSASVMSAPAALAFSKILYPETEKSVTKAEDIKIEKPNERNALEAASNGASNSIALVSNIVVNLIAAVSFIALLDGLLSWFGSLVHFEFITFDWLISKLFVPLSLIMGIEWKDKELVANLLGLKTVVNEFVAYRKLADFKKDNLLSSRSEAIATFALCGFSNIGSIGIQVGALGAMAPERKPDLASLAWRAMIAGSVACFMTACIAGALLKDFE